MSTRISFCEFPDQLQAGSAQWQDLMARVADQKTDLLVTNEMPFGAWVAREPYFNHPEAQACVQAHDAGMAQLAKLDVPAIITSRPSWAGARLTNEAFLIQRGQATSLHEKHYFPHEPIFYERGWFETHKMGFESARCGSLQVGVLLCTELMFTEWARHYRRQGAHVIAAPRCSGLHMDYWLAAGRMAAIMSGCYVVSSNRISLPGAAAEFGGQGFAFSPIGELLATTSPDNPVVTIEVDMEQVRRAQDDYPCNVLEAMPPG